MDVHRAISAPQLQPFAHVEAGLKRHAFPLPDGTPNFSKGIKFWECPTLIPFFRSILLLVVVVVVVVVVGAVDQWGHGFK